MPRKSYFTLSTGYKVEKGQPDSDEHLMSAIVGECAVEVRNHQTWETPDQFADALTRRVYQECEYLSRRYNLCVWRLLGAATDQIFDIMKSLQGKLGEGDCEDCEHKDECAAATEHRCDSELMN